MDDEQKRRGRLITRRTVLKGGLGALGTVAVLGTGGATAYLATRYGAGPPHEGDLVLTGGTILLGPALEPVDRATVLVRDGVIVDAAADVASPAGAEVIDLAGATLLPGLIDLHVHLGIPEMERDEEVGATRIPGIVWDAVRYVPGVRRSLLQHGVTSVRSLGDDHAWVMELRQAVADGELEGPRVFAAGPVFTTPGGHPIVTFGVEPDSDSVRVPGDADDARRLVRDLARGADPVDCIKVIQERGDERRAMEPHDLEVLRAIVAAAHDHDLPVTAHWGTVEDLAEVLDAGVDGLEHVEARGALDRWPDGVVEDLVSRQVALTPTLAVTEVAVPEDDHARLQERVAEFHAAGGRVVAGSDAGVPGVPFGGGLHRELELLVSSGLTPAEALQAATSEAAAVLRTDEVGVIEPGRAADLVAVDGDPLADIRAVRNVIMVLRDGRLVTDTRG
jgi:imidazolonepropionase-like amidohydrolase